MAFARRNHHLVKGEKVKWSRKGKGGSHAMTKNSDRGVVTLVRDDGYLVKWTKGALKGSSTFVPDQGLVSARSTSRSWPGNHYEGIDPKARKNPSQGRPMTYEELQAMAKRVANASNIGGFLRFTPAMDREDAISALVVAVLEASGGNFKDVSEQEALQVMKKEKRKLVRQQKSVPPLLPGHLHPIASTLDEEALTHAMGMDYRAGKRQAKRDFERSTGPGSEPMTKAELERHGKKVAYISGYLDQIREEEKEEKEWARKNPSGLPGWKRRLGQMGYAEGLEQAKRDFERSMDPDFEVKTKVELEQGPFSPEYIRGYLEQIREEEEEWDRNPPTTEDDLYEPDDWLDNPRKNPRLTVGQRVKYSDEAINALLERQKWHSGMKAYGAGTVAQRKKRYIQEHRDRRGIITKANPNMTAYIVKWESNPSGDPRDESMLNVPGHYLVAANSHKKKQRRNTMTRNNPDKWARMAAERKKRLAAQRGGKKYTRKPARDGRSGWPEEICGMSLLTGVSSYAQYEPQRGSNIYLTFQKNAGTPDPEWTWTFNYGTHEPGDAQRGGRARTKAKIIAKAKRLCEGGFPGHEQEPSSVRSVYDPSSVRSVYDPSGGFGGGRRVHLSGASIDQLMRYADDSWSSLEGPARKELEKRGYTSGGTYGWTKKARKNPDDDEWARMAAERQRRLAEFKGSPKQQEYFERKTTKGGLPSDFRERHGPKTGTKLADTYARIQRFGGHGPFLYHGHRFWRDYKGRGWWVILKNEPGGFVKVYGPSPRMTVPFTEAEAQRVLEEASGWARNNMGFKLTDSEGRVHEADTFEEYLQMKKDMGGGKKKRSRAASKPRGRGRREFTPPKNPNAVVSRKQAFSLVKYLKPQVESDTPWRDAIDGMIAHGMTQQQWYDSMQLARNKRKIPAMKRKLEEWARG